MRILMTFYDIKKLIEESYNGVDKVTSENDDMEIMVDVDSDLFVKKSKTNVSNNNTQNSNSSITKSNLPEFSPGAKVDYETIMLKKEMDKEEQTKHGKKLVEETHIPLVKTLDEKNEEAIKKKLMTTGRGAKRSIVKG